MDFAAPEKRLSAIAAIICRAGSEVLARAAPTQRRKKALGSQLAFYLPPAYGTLTTKLMRTDSDDRANHFPRRAPYFPGNGAAVCRSRNRSVSCPMGEGRYCATGALAQGRRRGSTLLYCAGSVRRHGP